MNKIKILVCEDILANQQDIQLYLDELNIELANIDIVTVIKDFDSVIEELRHDYQLLILDFFDGDELKGDRILNHNKINKIPTIIYTSKSESEQVDYDKLRIEYSPFLRKYLPRLRTGENLKSFIRSFLSSEGLIKKDYILYNQNDLFLVNSIISIGENHFNEILSTIIADNSLNGQVTIHRMTSGLSGAILFKIENNNKFSILKISKEIDKLKKEHENSTKLYQEFPSRLTNYINPKEYYSFDKTVLGILLKDVNNSITFFDFLFESTTTNEEIENYLNNLFLSNQSLQTHYSSNKGVINDWSYIFHKIDSLKFTLIDISLKELYPIIVKYDSNIELVNIRNLVLNNSYGNLDKSKLLETPFQKALVLCHGDLHSKNILVQNSKLPVIIDTGSIDYEYWCMDFCRLIVNLFIIGHDHNTIDYFDIEKIQSNIIVAEKIINQEPISLDGKNDKIITAINWLTNNCKDIYKDFFSTFEFQLGLMKEFLQASYRVDTVPPNKRTIALISANNCMMAANKSVNNAS
jgi:thiamine kinase-like enzyme